MGVLAGGKIEMWCPPGCREQHGREVDDLVHISDDHVVEATSGPEARRISVSIEVCSGRGSSTDPAVRIQGATDAPMTPAQAMQLASVLQATVFAALVSWQVPGYSRG